VFIQLPSPLKRPQRTKHVEYSCTWNARISNCEKREMWCSAYWVQRRSESSAAQLQQHISTNEYLPIRDVTHYR